MLWRRLTERSDPVEDMGGHLATLSQLAVRVNSSLNSDQVLGFVAEATSRLLDGSAALVLIADEGEELAICASHGVARPEVRMQNRFRPGEGLAGLVFETKAPLVLPDMLEDPRTLNRPWIEANGLSAFAGVPLLLRDQCLGVVCAMRGGGRPFGKLDVNLLEALAAHATMAITHARLYERAEVEGERLRALLDAMPEAISVGEAGAGEGSIHLVMGNRVRAELLRTATLMTGARTPDYEYLRPDGTPMEDAELPLQRAIWRGEAVRGMELAVRFPDGSQRHLLANAVLLPETTGARRAMVVFQDITQRKRMEEALRASEERFRRIADSNMIGIAFWDVGGGVREANQAFLDIIGYTQEDLRSGKVRWRDITPAEYAILDDRALQEIRRSGMCTPIEKEYIRKDGRRVPILLGASLLEKSGSEGVAFVLDLTERRKAEQELERVAADNAALYARAAREAQVKGLLLQELHHRVRNNLALIASFLVLQKESPAGRQALPVLEDAIARVQGLALVHNALADADFQAGDYAALARRLADQTLLQEPLAGRVAVLVEDVQLRLPSAQLTALGLITNELFTNIAKHAFPEGRSGTVNVSAESADGWVTVRVRDDGVGLPSGFMKQPGHLGLELIHSLVEVSLKGTFGFETGQGTTAVIRFPHPR